MEFGSTLQFLENKSILITGVTGYLGKITAEKILRIQPNIKRLYLLLRAPDAPSATKRFNDEIIGKALFKVLKEKFGGNLDSFISEKVTLVPGDTSCDSLGVKNPHLMKEMYAEVDAVIHLAATTNFDERYDVALKINTLGAKHMLTFAKKCENIKVVVHVSTAYVCGEREGLIKEEPFYMGQTLNGRPKFDIDLEVKLANEAINDLQADGVSEKEITRAMKDLGLARAKKHGWPNTYVFTKAMGEMLVGKLREEIPIVILRPSIVTSTLKEPFPGWVEGLRTIDSVIVGYSKGRFSFFLGDPNCIMDCLPADMVANSILVSMVASANVPSETIYHVGSSLKNPVKTSDILDTAYKYFTKKPWINKDGTPVIVRKLKLMTNISSFHRYTSIYLFFLKALKLANTAFCQALHKPYTDTNRKIRYMMRMAELYTPYAFFKAILDDTNTEKLRKFAREGSDKENEVDLFCFEPKEIDWEDYFINVHYPGVVKHVYK